MPAIETFTPPTHTTTRNLIEVRLRGSLFPAFVVTTYAVSIGDNIKIAETLEVLTNASWVTFVYDFTNLSWLNAETLIAETAIELILNTTQAQQITNEGDVILHEHHASVLVATTVTGDTLYSRVSSDGMFWFHMDGSSYTGDLTTITVQGSSTSSTTHHVESWFAQVDTSTNSWSPVFKVVTLSADGVVLQSVFYSASGVLVDLGGLEVRQTATSLQETEVYTLTSVGDQAQLLDTATLLAGRRLLALTINVNVPAKRVGLAHATLILGNTSQVLPIGLKTYSDIESSDARIHTFPKLSFWGGTRVDVDLRFLRPPTIAPFPQTLTTNT